MNKYHIDPQAFVAWTEEEPAPLSVSGVEEWQIALNVLYEEWRTQGYPLQACMKDYTDKLISFGYTQSEDGIMPEIKTYKISGCVDLTTYDR